MLFHYQHPKYSLPNPRFNPSQFSTNLNFPELSKNNDLNISLFATARWHGICHLRTINIISGSEAIDEMFARAFWKWYRNMGCWHAKSMLISNTFMSWPVSATATIWSRGVHRKATELVSLSGNCSKSHATYGNWRYKVSEREKNFHDITEQDHLLNIKIVVSVK